VGAEGTTTETANLTAALATLTGVRHYWYVGTCSDATGYAAWEAHVTTKSYARPGLRCQAIVAFAGTQALAQTRAVAQNYERLTLVHQTGCDVHPAFLAGGICGELAMGYDADPSANLNGLQLNWLPPAPLASEWPDDDDINSALCDGVTIIRSTESGAYMVKHVTTRSKDSTGTYADRRAWSGHKIKGADSFCDTIIARHAAQFQGYKLKDDKRDSAGKIDSNQYIPAKTTTPSLLKKWAIGVVREYGESGLNVLQNENATIASMRFQRDPNNVNRVEAAINIEIIDHHDQSTFRVDEVSAG
jgi:phage tail sheath gpL-like